MDWASLWAIFGFTVQKLFQQYRYACRTNMDRVMADNQEIEYIALRSYNHAKFERIEESQVELAKAYITMPPEEFKAVVNQMEKYGKGIAPNIYEQGNELYINDSYFSADSCLLSAGKAKPLTGTPIADEKLEGMATRFNDLVNSTRPETVTAARQAFLDSISTLPKKEKIDLLSRVNEIDKITGDNLQQRFLEIPNIIIPAYDQNIYYAARTHELINSNKVAEAQVLLAKAYGTMTDADYKAVVNHLESIGKQAGNSQIYEHGSKLYKDEGLFGDIPLISIVPKTNVGYPLTDKDFGQTIRKFNNLMNEPNFAMPARQAFWEFVYSLPADQANDVLHRANGINKQLVSDNIAKIGDINTVKEIRTRAEEIYKKMDTEIVKSPSRWDKTYSFELAKSYLNLPQEQFSALYREMADTRADYKYHLHLDGSKARVAGALVFDKERKRITSEPLRDEKLETIACRFADLVLDPYYSGPGFWAPRQTMNITVAAGEALMEHARSLPANKRQTLLGRVREITDELEHSSDFYPRISIKYPHMDFLFNYGTRGPKSRSTYD